MTTKPIKTGVIGHPISHSKSPLIHGYWLDLYKLSGSYEAIDIAPDTLEQGAQNLIDQGYSGFNVTLPHKAAIMDLCAGVDDLAQAIGAVNTVTIKKGKLYGTNTDAFGFVQNIKEMVSRQNWDWSFDGGKAVILGAGGAANAVIHALLEEGVPEIAITNRTREKAEILTSRDVRKITAYDWNTRNDCFKDANLIINCSALGMAGNAALEVDLKSAPDHALVTDIVYAPLYTDLLTQAKARHLRAVTGIGMLLQQARPGFELWNGVMPEVTPELEKLVL
tara:strand:+ start:1366 stop:2202 length:837 start_codon:yes stop_codon:yes gene_type:complete